MSREVAVLADGWSVVAHVHHAGDDVPEGAVKVVDTVTIWMAALPRKGVNPLLPTELLTEA